ncbi:MAG: extracellular solute-binding protein, partial [Clostridia bacterium]|nr:extracellular solute-binding protein [Clostridia bacterium]
MNNKKLRLIALMLVLAMTVIASLSGCGPKKSLVDGTSGDYVMDPVLNPLGSETICKETVTLEFMMGKAGTVIDYETNAFTKRLEEKGNVEIKFNLLASDDSTSKINLVLSSGNNLPDVINSSLDDTTVTTYGAAGTFVALNDYYANSSEYLMPRIEQYEEDYGVNLLDYITMSDGNIYTMAAFNESIHNNFPFVIWIYEPWLKKLGMELPTTLDEYVECLKAFRDKDPNGNGQKDELPVIDYARPITSDGFMYAFLQAFIKTGAYNTALKDGELSMYYTTEEYKEFLKWMKMLYTEGLLDKTTFSQDASTRKTLLNGQTTRVGSFVHTSTSVITAGDKRRENYEYKPVFLENGDESTIYFTNSIMPANKYFITSACEHPEVAFRLGDFMSGDEMTIWTRWGEKGVDWVDPPAGSKSMYDFLGYDAFMETVTQWGTVQN